MALLIQPGTNGKKKARERRQEAVVHALAVDAWKTHTLVSGIRSRLVPGTNDTKKEAADGDKASAPN